MNFSDCIEHTGSVVEYSPDGRFVALSRAFDVLVSPGRIELAYI